MNFNKCFLMIALIFLSSCTQPEKAKRVLETQGYTNIRMQGYDFFNCSKNDIYHDKFSANTPNGSRVTGSVCGGYFLKGSMVRID